jgi:hypothetical protein
MENHSMHWKLLQYLLFDSQYCITSWLVTCLCNWNCRGQASSGGLVTHRYEVAVVRLSTRHHNDTTAAPPRWCPGYA